jgi:hypothetical protein
MRVSYLALLTLVVGEASARDYTFLANGFCGPDTLSFQYDVSSLSSTYPNLDQYQTTASSTTTNGWYASSAANAAGMCYIQSVANCQAICDAVAGCNAISISTTRSCYACFIYKTCSAPFDSYTSTPTQNYQIYVATPNPLPRTCAEIKAKDSTVRSGIYIIDPGADYSTNTAVAPFQVYCDMETDGGGWALVQKRRNDGANFLVSGLVEPTLSSWGSTMADSQFMALKVSAYEVLVQMSGTQNYCTSCSTCIVANVSDLIRSSYCESFGGESCGAQTRIVLVLADADHPSSNLICDEQISPVQTPGPGRIQRTKAALELGWTTRTFWATLQRGRTGSAG